VKCIGHVIQPVFLMFICSTWLWGQTLSTRPAEPILQPSNSIPLLAPVSSVPLTVQARTPLRVVQDQVRIRKLGQQAGPWPHPSHVWLHAVARSPSARRRFWLRRPDLYSLWRSQGQTVICPVTRERQWVRSRRCLPLASTNSSNSMCACRRGKKLCQNRPSALSSAHENQGEGDRQATRLEADQS